MMGGMIDVFLKYIYEVNAMKRNDQNNKNTFIVKIDHNQHETWQGEVVWAEGNRSRRFRSVLELLKLMDEAMGDGGEINLRERGVG